MEKKKSENRESIISPIKMQRIMSVIVAAILALVMAVSLTACGKNDEPLTAENAEEINDIAIDGIMYSLDGGWKYDETNFSFKNGSITATINNDIVDECTKAEDRFVLANNPEEGIEATKIKVNGTDAVYTEEAVNEIMYCELFFYVDGVEHELVIECDYDKYEDSKKKINKFIKGISW